MDKKMLHESLPDHSFGRLQARAENGSTGGRDHRRDAEASPAAAENQLRHDVLARVVRISGALNQRLAL